MNDLRRIEARLDAKALAFVSENVSTDWQSLPGLIAVAALTDLCSEMTGEGIDLATVSLQDIGQAIGFLNEAGEWT